MKKIGLWKKLASWLLVFLLVLQIPTDVFAEEWISGTDISVDSDFAEEDAGYVEEEENTDFIDDEKIEVVTSSLIAQYMVIKEKLVQISTEMKYPLKTIENRIENIKSQLQTM